MNAAENIPAGAPSRMPIYLSALLVPGAGQFLQRRWFPALFYLITFLASFCVLTLELVRGMISFVHSAMEGDLTWSYTGLSSRKILLSLGFGLVIYVIGLCDTYIAYVRECRAWGERKMADTLRKLTPIVLAFLVPTLLFAADAAPLELHRAIIAGDLLKLDALLESGGTGRVNSVVANGVTPLHLAAAMDQTAAVGMLVAKGANMQARTTAGFTPLHWAAGKDALRAATLLVRLGADINAQAAKGITPLHWAAGKNATNVVKLLIAAGANLQDKTESGLTPLHWAVMNKASTAAILLAYKTVSDDMDREPPQQPGTAAGAAADGATEDTSPPSEMPETPPSAGPRPVFGTSLRVPIGRGEELAFVWLKNLKLWAGKYEVTNGQYRRFKLQHNSMFRETFSLNGNDQPAVCVSWDDAKAFCQWLNKDFADRLPLGCEFRLPLEAEWILMAKCGDNRKYPWGNAWPPKYGNYSDLTARTSLSEWQGITGYDDGHAVTCPVAESGVNEWGIYGLAGNVWEWCEDWFDSSKTRKVRHGASWDFDEKPSLAILFRGFDRPDVRDDTVGFRIVASPK